MRGAASVLAAAAVLVGCSATRDGEPADASVEPAVEDAQGPLPGYEITTSRAGMFTAAWRPLGDGVPNNEPFEIEVLLFEGAGIEQPLEGARVLISAWMPDHAHGMLREPRAIEESPGRYRVRGMLLHMGGFWQIFVDVVRDGVSERAQFELTIE
ncbi:MAG: FixH family protein [Planctomycetota bacterium]